MLELKYVDKRYPASNALLYVHELTIASGEIVGILGENGSGKTTLLKAMMGIGELGNGEVLFDGKPASQQYERIAFVTEEGSYLSSLTPLQYGELLNGFFPQFDRAYYTDLLHAYELPVRRKIRTLSKGQKGKLEMCAGLAKRADYLIMDEPFSGSDLFSRRDLLKRMISGLSGQETVLLTTHLVDEIENVVDRIIVMHKGLVRADVYIDELREQGKTIADAMQEARTSRRPDGMPWPD